MGFDFGIDDGTFSFSADTRPADLADQLYLFAAKFAMPRWDASPVERAKAAARLQYDSFATSPQGVLQRDLAYYQHGEDPRYATPTPQQIDQATPEGFKQVWAPIIARRHIEVQVFGDFDRDAIITALNRTFGALPQRLPLPASATASTVAQPAPSFAPIVLTHRGDANQAAALISWPTGGGSAGIPESRQLDVLAQLFSNRLLEAMREKSGASYAPQVYSNWPIDLANGGSLVAIAQLTPRDVPVFYATADEIAADLAAHPPSADELARVVGPMTQQVNRALSSVAFFMSQLEGATSDPKRVSALSTVVTDYTQVTPAVMQALAEKYLVRDKSWRLAVIPQGQKLAAEHPSEAISLASH
jgi:zinc protease